MEQLILGLKRGSTAPADWQGELQRLPGVRVVAVPTSRTARIEVSPGAREGVRLAFGDHFHIEPLLEHSRY